MLFWFYPKEPYEFIKVMKNTLYPWIASLNNNCYIIIHLFIPNDRDFYTKTITLIILIKPFRK